MRQVIEAGGVAKEEPDYFVARELADMLRLSEKSIYRIVREDPTFPYVRVGRGAMRFPRERVRRWLAKRTQGGK
jgi:excisionase family DNA binding protein